VNRLVTADFMCESCADPLMKVRGHKDIALEFYGLIKAFSDVKLDQKRLTVTEGSRPDVYEASTARTSICGRTDELRGQGICGRCAVV
jgi:hypothetical protein